VSAFNTRIPIGGINLNLRSTHLNNITESVLVESRSARTSQLSNLSDERALETLNKAKALVMALWQGTGVATNAQLADYYEISEDVVRDNVRRNKEEFDQDGVKVLKGSDLKLVSECISLTSHTKRLTVWTPRAALRLGMLLEDSTVARKVRSVILDVVQAASPVQPPANPFDGLGDAITAAVAELVRLELAKHSQPQQPHYSSQLNAQLPPSVVKLIDKREKTRHAYSALLEIRDQWCQSKQISEVMLGDCSFCVAVRNGDVPEALPLLEFTKWGNSSGISRATLCRARKRIKDGETFRKNPHASR
jgi:hypothetical protein